MLTRIIRFVLGGPGYSLTRTLRFNWRYFGWEGVRFRPVHVSRNVHLERLQGSVVVADVRRRGAVRLGFGYVDVFDRRTVRAQWANRGIVRFRGSADLTHGFRLSVHPDARLELGDNVYSGGTAMLVSRCSMTIGADSMVSWGATVMDTDLHTIRHEADGPVVNEDAPVVLGERVLIGTGAFVGKGTRIADGSIVGAGAVCSGSHDDEGSVLVGNPAVVVRTGVHWER